MKATDDDLREALGLGQPRSMAERATCPTAEELTTQAEGAGDSATRARIVEHVARCARCAFELRLAGSLRPWAEGAALALSPAAAPASRLRPRPGWWPAALAASLLAAVGLAGWNVELRQRRLDLEARLDAGQQREMEAVRRLHAADAALAAARTPAPVPNVPIVDLEPAAARGAAGEPTRVRLAQDAAWVTFVLAVAGPPVGGEHGLEIRGQDEHVVWRGERLVANRFGSFTVALPQALLPPGSYDFRLTRPAGAGDARTVQAYRLVVGPQAP